MNKKSIARLFGIAVLAALAAIWVYALRTITHTFAEGTIVEDDDRAYMTSLKFLMTALALIAVPSFIKVAEGKCRGRVLPISVGIFTAIVLAILAIMVIALVGDALHLDCYEIFGNFISNVNCVDGTGMLLSYYLLRGSVILPFVCFSSVVLLVGLYQELRIKDKKLV